MINEFLKYYRVDVCRSLAVLFFSSAVTDTMAMIVQPAFTGTFALDFSPIIGVVLTCALWMRRPWVRKFLIGIGWLVAVGVPGATIKVLFFGSMALTFNGTTVAKPTVGQYVSLLVVAVPLVYVVLRILHSEKFREEIYAATDGEKKEQVQLPATPGNGT